jgi:hypothetical protein
MLIAARVGKDLQGVPHGHSLGAPRFGHENFS